MSVAVKKEKTKHTNISKKKVAVKKTVKQGSLESVLKAIENAQKNPISFINQW